MLGTDNLTDEDKASIRNLVETWTDDLAASRYDAWLECWADNAYLMPPGGPRIEGRVGLAEFAKKFEMHGGYRFEDWSFAGAQDLAVMYNRIVLEADGQNASNEQLFDQVIILCRFSGAWKIQTVIFTPTSL